MDGRQCKAIDSLDTHHFVHLKITQIEINSIIIWSAHKEYIVRHTDIFRSYFIIQLATEIKEKKWQIEWSMDINRRFFAQGFFFFCITTSLNDHHQMKLCSRYNNEKTTFDTALSAAMHPNAYFHLKTTIRFQFRLFRIEHIIFFLFVFFYCKILMPFVVICKIDILPEITWWYLTNANVQQL